MKKLLLIFVPILIAQSEGQENSLLQPSARMVIEKNCTRCHSGASAPGNIRLDSWLNVSIRVQAYNPEKSIIMQALTGMGKVQMPPGEGLLWKEINAVRRWIIGGADSKSYEERMQMTTMGGSDTNEEKK